MIDTARAEPQEYDPKARGWRSHDSTLHCASPFGNCAAWFQDSRRSSFRGAIINGWTRDKQHLWLCPECSVDVDRKRTHDLIVAIEPDIRADERRKVLDELIAMIEAEADDTVWLTDSETMVDRLASLRTPDDTTTAFVASLTPDQRDYVRPRIDATSGSID